MRTQFDRVAFKQCWKSLFNGLFDFDRQLKDTMAYANTQKNGSLLERLQMDILEPEMPIPPDSIREEATATRQLNAAVQTEHAPSEQIHIKLTDDIDDEPVYGRNRRRQNLRGR